MVVKDEREVIVQVDLKSSNTENKITSSQETTRNLLKETTLGIRYNRPSCPNLPKTLPSLALPCSKTLQSSLGLTKEELRSLSLAFKALYHLTVTIFSDTLVRLVSLSLPSPINSPHTTALYTAFTRMPSPTPLSSSLSIF